MISDSSNTRKESVVLTGRIVKDSSPNKSLEISFGVVLTVR